MQPPRITSHHFIFRVFYVFSVHCGFQQKTLAKLLFVILGEFYIAPLGQETELIPYYLHQIIVRKLFGVDIARRSHQTFLGELIA